MLQKLIEQAVCISLDGMPETAWDYLEENGAPMGLKEIWYSPSRYNPQRIGRYYNWNFLYASNGFIPACSITPPVKNVFELLRIYHATGISGWSANKLAYYVNNDHLVASISPSYKSVEKAYTSLIYNWFTHGTY